MHRPCLSYTDAVEPLTAIILYDVLNATYKNKPPLMSLASVLRIELKGMLGLMSEHIIPLRQNINEK